MDPSQPNIYQDLLKPHFFYNTLQWFHTNLTHWLSEEWTLNVNINNNLLGVMINKYSADWTHTITQPLVWLVRDMTRGLADPKLGHSLASRQHVQKKKKRSKHDPDVIVVWSLSRWSDYGKIVFEWTQRGTAFSVCSQYEWQWIRLWPKYGHLVHDVLLLHLEEPCCRFLVLLWCKWPVYASFEWCSLFGTLLKKHEVHHTRGSTGTGLLLLLGNGKAMLSVT